MRRIDAPLTDTVFRAETCHHCLQFSQKTRGCAYQNAYWLPRLQNGMHWLRRFRDKAAGISCEIESDWGIVIPRKVEERMDWWMNKQMQQHTWPSLSERIISFDLRVVKYSTHTDRKYRKELHKDQSINCTAWPSRYDFQTPISAPPRRRSWLWHLNG